MNNLVSIITPSYKSSNFISLTIDSVLAQTYKNWEMIVVDDFSPDNSNELIEKYCQKDNRIKLIKLERNLGAAEARNKALEYSSGRYIAFLDSDDIWYDTKLEKQILFMQNNHYPISYTSYELIDELGKAKNHVIEAVDNLNLHEYLKNTIIGFSTSIIDRKLINDEIKFLNIRMRQDTNLWINLLKNGYSAHGLTEVLVKYRVHSNSISANKIKAAKQVWNLYFNIHKFGLLKSLYYFIFYAYNALKKRYISSSKKLK